MAPLQSNATAVLTTDLPAPIAGNQGKSRTMRPVIGFFLLCWSVTAYAQQPYFKPPTATELFNLRSRCAALGNKFLDDDPLVGRSSLTKTIISHYDPRTNHCYGDEVTQNVANPDSYFNRFLFDLQTGEMLAFARRTAKEKQNGIVVGGPLDMRDDHGFSAANEYIDKLMQEDR